MCRCPVRGCRRMLNTLGWAGLVLTDTERSVLHVLGQWMPGLLAEGLSNCGVTVLLPCV